MMQTQFAVAVLVAWVSLPHAAAATPLEDSSTATEEQRVLAVEDQYVAAEIHRDEATLRKLVDERFILNSRDGSTSGKEALIRSVLGMNMRGQTISERTVVVEGDLAIICGTAELQLGTLGVDERTSVLRYTSVYVRREAQWRMLALHMAPRSSRLP